MLIAKGYRVAFEVGGRIVRARGAMLHDPDGKAWPQNSILVADFNRGRGHVDDAEARRYFGYQAKHGSITLPPKALSQWSRVGEVTRIEYFRPGEHEGRFFHPFEEGGWIFQKEHPVLYKRRGQCRMELQKGCVINWRGFVWP